MLLVVGLRGRRSGVMDMNPEPQLECSPNNNLVCQPVRPNPKLGRKKCPQDGLCKRLEDPLDVGSSWTRQLVMGWRNGGMAAG